MSVRQPRALPNELFATRRKMRGLRTTALALLGTIVLLLPPAYLLAYKHRAATEPDQVLAAYLKASYARDFAAAYRLISVRDRRLKTERVYAQERGSFTGFTLEVARKLSEFVRFERTHSEVDTKQARIKMKLQFPDPDKLSQLLSDWHEGTLNTLSRAEQRKILSLLDALGSENKLHMIDAEEESLLLKEGRNWRVFFDWASGVRVNFQAVVPASGTILAAPVTKETIVRRKEPFMIGYRVKNRTEHDIFARVIHRIEPAGFTRHLRMFECSLFVPVRLSPGEQSNYSTTYMVDGDLPDIVKELSVTYEFQLEN
jgi:hypothetical protein